MASSLGGSSWRRNIDQTVRSLLVEPDHPVPQRLTIHATDLRRLFPRGAVEHRRNRQKPSRLRSIFRSLGKPANFAGRIVRPHRNRLSHGKPPPFAILNHVASDSGIPESQPLSGLVLLRGRTDDWLFPGQRGGAKANTLFSGQITQRIYQTTGLRMTVHQFRHAAGAIILKHRPGEYELVRQLLGHRNVQTTINAYIGLENIHASEIFGKIIMKQMDDELEAAE